MVKFLSKHPLNYAMTATPTKYYSQMVYEFWYSCNNNKEQKGMIGTILNGSQALLINPRILREVLQLPIKEKGKYDDLVDMEEISNMLGHTRYESLPFEGSMFLRRKLFATYNYLFANLLFCFSCKIGSLDQFSSNEAQVAYAMVMGKTIDIGRWLYTEMREIIEKKSLADAVRFPRFLAWCFEYELRPKYIQVDL